MFRSSVARALASVGRFHSGKKKEATEEKTKNVFGTSASSVSRRQKKRGACVCATQMRRRREDEENARRERCVPRGDDQSRVTSTARGDAVGVGVQGLFTERTGGVDRVE